MNEEISIIGDWPDLTGKEIQEFIAQEFWCDGELEDASNVLYIKASNEWIRLYFDYEIIFWKNGPNGIDDPNADQGIEFGYPLNDLARSLDLIGEKIKECEPQRVENGVSVKFVFSNGKCIEISSVNDQTRIKT